MRLFIPSLVLLSLFTLSAHAQSSRWQIGLKAGMGLTGGWQTRPATNVLIKTERFRPRMGLQVGGRVSYKLVDQLFLETGVDYQIMQDAVRRYVQSPQEDSPAVYAGQRLQIPLLLRYQIGQRLNRPYLLAGVMPSRLLALRIKNNDQAIDLNDYYDTGPVRRIRRNWLPIIFGIGIPLGKQFSVEIAYQHVSKPLEFLSSNPGTLLIFVPTEESKLNQGLFVSMSYWLN